MYADDLVFVDNDLNDVSEAIDIIERWSEEYGMKINKKKSGIMFLTKRKISNYPSENF
jgi:hypothetical protein